MQTAPTAAQIAFQLFLTNTCPQHITTTATIEPLRPNFGFNSDLNCLLQNQTQQLIPYRA